MSVAHKPRYVDEYKTHAEIMADALRLSAHQLHGRRPRPPSGWARRTIIGGVRDTGTGHIHPLKLLVGTAKAAAARRRARCSSRPVHRHLSRAAARSVVTTPSGTITADKGLIAVNAYGGDLEPVSAAHVMPIGSFIGATVPLPADTPVLPGGEAVDDSRFVVRYFRKSADNRLLFGGREIYGVKDPEGHPHPHPPADRRDLSGAEGYRDSRMAGAAMSASPCRASPSCAR